MDENATRDVPDKEGTVDLEDTVSETGDAAGPSTSQRPVCPGTDILDHASSPCPAKAGYFDDLVTAPDDLDALLAAAAPSGSAAVCAVIYIARVDRVQVQLTALNLLGITSAALALAATYVDRDTSADACARIAAAAGITPDVLADMVSELIKVLPGNGKYISPASFREFEELLDALC